MATLPRIQQPELRAYPVMDRLPSGCIMFPVVNEDAWPVFRPGEIVVVDPEQCDPTHQEMFVVEWGKASGNARKALVEVWAVAGRYGSGPNGEMIDGFGWWVGAYNRSRSAGEAHERLQRGQPVGFCDGPYASEGRNADVLKSKLVGRVIGILEPAFDESNLRRVN